MTKAKKSLSLFLAVLMILSSLVVFSSAAAVSISKCDIKYTAIRNYTGKAIKPSVKLTYKSKTLKSGTDYTTAYSNNKSIGTATITIKGKGNYTGSTKVYFNIVLGKPTGLKAASVTDTSAKLSWTKVTGASSYNIYSYNTSTKKYTKLASASSTSAKVKLTAGKANIFAVKAVKSKTLSEYSARLSVYALPSRVKITSATTTSNSATLSWSKVSGAKGYIVYSYNETTKKYSKIATITATTFTKSNLRSGMGYSFAVSAYYSAPTGSIIGKKSALATVPTTPAKVEGVSAKALTSSSVYLAWSPVSGATSYTIYSYNASNKSYTKIGTSKTVSYTASGLKELTSYSFAVAASTKAGTTTKTGAKSKVVSAKTPESNAFGDFESLIYSKKFSIGYSIKTSEGDIDGVATVDGKKAATSMEMTYSGLTMSMESRYFEDRKKGYVYADIDDVGMKIMAALAGMKLPMYREMTAAQADENGLDVNGITTMFLPTATTAPTKSTEKIGSKTYTTYTYFTKMGVPAVYYFDGTKLTQIKQGSQTITIKSISSSPSSSATALPKNFPKGYTKTTDLL